MDETNLLRAVGLFFLLAWFSGGIVFHILSTIDYFPERSKKFRYMALLLSSSKFALFVVDFFISLFRLAGFQ